MVYSVTHKSFLPLQFKSSHIHRYIKYIRKKTSTLTNTMVTPYIQTLIISPVCYLLFCYSSQHCISLNFWRTGTLSVLVFAPWQQVVSKLVVNVSNFIFITVFVSIRYLFFISVQCMLQACCVCPLWPLVGFVLLIIFKFILFHYAPTLLSGI